MMAFGKGRGGEGSGFWRAEEKEYIWCCMIFCRGDVSSLLGPSLCWVGVVSLGVVGCRLGESEGLRDVL